MLVCSQISGQNLEELINFGINFYEFLLIFIKIFFNFCFNQVRLVDRIWQIDFVEELINFYEFLLNLC